VTQSGPDSEPTWSPDGSRIAFESAMGNPAYYYSNGQIAVVSADGGTPTALTASFDEDPKIVAWNANGLFFAASERTYSYLYRIAPESQNAVKVAPSDPAVYSGFSMSRDGQAIAYLRSDAKSMAEVYVASLPSGFSRSAEKKITDMNAQAAMWTQTALE